MNKKELKILNVKELLTVKEVALLLNCSERTIYRYIENRKIKAVNLGNRLIRVKRVDIDKLYAIRNLLR